MLNDKYHQDTPPTELKSAVMGGVKRKKPPLGLIPHSIWKDKRVYEIVSAMDRFNDEGECIPPEWFTELYTLLK